MALGSVIEIGPFSFMPFRIYMAVAVVRIIIRGERLVGDVNGLDWMMVTWAAWALVSSLFHADTSGVLVNRLGLVYNACGSYFLLRVFCQSLDDMVTLCRSTAILLVPLSIEMLSEMITGHNFFSVLDAAPENSEMRDGRFRAQGPFAHSIIAGTIGAVCLPLMVGLWQEHRKTAAAGFAACFLMVFTSGSSGPIMSAVFAIGALFMWHWRHRMRLVRWLAVLGYIGLDLIMKAPPYYLIARIDLTGSSSSYHRAALIESAFAHLSEWWFAGTDFTSHWMAYSRTESQIDVTNHYLRMGIDGGLPLMLLFIGVLVSGFSFIGRILRKPELSSQSQFMIWVFGASLFAHSITFVSVSYFDQSVLFFYLTLAVIGSVWSGVIKKMVTESVDHRFQISSHLTSPLKTTAGDN